MSDVKTPSIFTPARKGDEILFSCRWQEMIAFSLTYLPFLEEVIHDSRYPVGVLGNQDLSNQETFIGTSTNLIKLAWFRIRRVGWNVAIALNQNEKSNSKINICKSMRPPAEYGTFL